MYDWVETGFSRSRWSCMWHTMWEHAARCFWLSSLSDVDVFIFSTISWLGHFHYVYARSVGGRGGGREQKSLSRSHLAAYIIESEGQYFTTTMFRFFLFFHHLSALRRPKTRVSSRKDFRVMKRQQQNIERATTAKKHENFILCFVRVRVCGSEIKYM